MNKTKPLTKKQIKTLDHYLTEYDRDMSFEAILQAVLNNDDSVSIWEPFEYWPKQDIIDLFKNVE